MNIGNNILGN